MILFQNSSYLKLVNKDTLRINYLIQYHDNSTFPRIAAHIGTFQLSFPNGKSSTNVERKQIIETRNEN